MSEIKKQLQSKLKVAMKARDQRTLLTLRGLSAAVKQYEVDSREDAGEEQIVSIIQKEIKKRRDALGYAEQQNREDLIQQNKNEIALLQEFLGDQLGEDELKKIIQEQIDAGAGSIGPIMGHLNKNYKGQFEGKTASRIAKDLLES